jgi:nicotinate-nucleotide pyrophosphorylase (carboxylating)
MSAERKMPNLEPNVPPPRRVTPLETPAVPRDGLRFPLTRDQLAARVREALEEDGAFNDITTIATVRTDRRARAALVARQGGTIAGIPFALETFRMLDPKVSMRVDVEDGKRAMRGETVIYISGHARAMLSAERVALNFLMRLSGVSTLTSRYVDAVRGTGVKILDTRKTTPGWRSLEKYAVRAGGGTNHRMDLASSVLIKDNHLAAVDGHVEIAIKRARELAPASARIEIECITVDQVAAAAEAGADNNQLDNMPLELMKECVRVTAKRAELEASGGVTLENVRAIAGTGVDMISIGALTHSAAALNLALDFE